MTCRSLSPVSVPSLQMTALRTLPGKTHSWRAVNFPLTKITPLIGPRHGACNSALRIVNISKLHQKLKTSINLMSSCTVRTFLGWRLINIWAFISRAACPGKTTLIMCTPTVPGRLAFCATYNVKSGQQLFGRSSSEQSDHGSSMPAPCGAGKYQRVGQTSRTVLPPAPDCLTSIATAIWLSHIGVVLQDQVWPFCFHSHWRAQKESTAFWKTQFITYS